MSMPTLPWYRNNSCTSYLRGSKTLQTSDIPGHFIAPVIITGEDTVQYMSLEATVPEEQNKQGKGAILAYYSGSGPSASPISFRARANSTEYK